MVDEAAILAEVTAYLNSEGPEPREWQLFLYCEHWKALPEAGGMLDQDRQLMQCFQLYTKGRNDHKALKEAVQTALQKPPTAPAKPGGNPKLRKSLGKRD